MHARRAEVQAIGAEQPAQSGRYGKAADVVYVRFHVIRRFEVGEFQIAGAVQLGCHGPQESVAGAGGMRARAENKSHPKTPAHWLVSALEGRESTGGRSWDFCFFSI